MRKIKDPQMQLGSVAIDQIKFDLRSRDEIPKVLMGLQHIYCTSEIRDEVFSILEKAVPAGIDRKDGRPGMDLWTILVLGAIRLSCNWDYDKLQEIANNHKTLRLMLGHGVMDNSLYALQTLKDNVSLLTPEILDEINQVVVKAGHDLMGKKKEEKLEARCDSFVVETDVHYPTDINLLFDSIFKVIHLIATICGLLHITTWRQSAHNIRKVKKLFRKAQKLKRSSSKNEKKKLEREKLIIEAHQAYIDLVSSFLDRSKETISFIRNKTSDYEADVQEIEKYMAHAVRQIGQIRRRVIEGEKISHDEKVFSVFEEHTEWICKGKAGVRQELGLRVCILEDQYGFILYHHVMQNQTDDAIAVSVTKETKARFPELSSCSYDKGFHSPSNQKELQEMLDLVVLPRKGKLSLKAKEIQQAEPFVRGRKKHSAVESAINALENHGLDRCLDNGISGFKRYVGFAVLARNIQILGHIIQTKEVAYEKRLKRLSYKRRQGGIPLAA